MLEHAAQRRESLIAGSTRTLKSFNVMKRTRKMSIKELQRLEGLPAVIERTNILARSPIKMALIGRTDPGMCAFKIAFQSSDYDLLVLSKSQSKPIQLSTICGAFAFLPM
jgi:hypothetical protein